MTQRGAKKSTNHRRAVIVAGLRTPFVKANTVFKDLSALDLAKRVVTEMMSRADLDPALVDRVVYGQVIPSVEAPNIAREVVLGTGLPRSIDAYSVSRACATSTQATVDAATAILHGEADVAIAGGADSLSKPPITYSENFIGALMDANSAKDPMSKAKAFKDLRPKDLMPKPPALQEKATGLTMGESAEKMAKDNSIPREDQDMLALRSHQRTTEAWEKGIYAEEVMTVLAGEHYDVPVSKDGIVRTDTTLEKLAKLKPVFDRKYGTITAGNSSPLTDGASALVLMSEEKAKELGYEPLASVRTWAFAAVDPDWQLLMAPYFAAPRALDQAGVKLEQLDLVDMHEAFAAQVLSTTEAFASPQWARSYLGREEPIGEVPSDKLNVHGGSIAIGHPFAATGARQLLTVSRELARRGSGRALITQCAAGGLGAAVVLER